MIPISCHLRIISAKVHKGDVRNTVLNQVKNLTHIVVLLEQCKSIKDNEIEEYKEKDSDKVQHLKGQTEILDSGIRAVTNAVNVLGEYKDTISKNNSGS